MRILIGVDGGPQEPAALTLAAELAQVEPSRLTLVHAYGRGDGEGGEAILNGAANWLAGLAPRLRLVPGPAAPTLHALAAEERADVIVLGSCHRGPAGRIVLGGTGDRVVHRAPCAVAIAPRGYEGAADPLRRVALADDGRREDGPARTWAGDLGHRLGGAPAAMPVAAAVALTPGEADLVVVGAHGHGPVGETVRGGVPRRLMHQARVPLFVIPPNGGRFAPPETGSGPPRAPRPSARGNGDAPERRAPRG